MTRIHHRLIGVLALTSILGALACGGSDSTSPGTSTDQRTALTQAESQWTAAGIHNYNYDFISDRLGQHDSVQVQVRADQLTLSQSYLTGQTSSVGETIPDLFSAVDDALNIGLPVTITYNQQLGYPARGQLNQGSSSATSVSWQVVNFTQLP